MIYIYIYDVYAYGRKTVRAFCFFLEYCSLSWGWGGVGWGGMLTFLVLRTWSIAMLLRSLGSLTTWHVAMLLRSLVWVGVGGHVNVPGTSYMIYCHVAKISGIAYYVTCCYASTFEASTFDAHDVYLICQTSIDFASTFFDQNSVFQRVRKSILYCKLQVIVTLLEATKQNARAVSLPPGYIYIYIYIYDHICMCV